MTKVSSMKFIKLFFLYSILLLPQFSTAQTDWLIQPIQQKANINIQDNYIELNNGLAKRIFFIGPNLACIDYTNLSNGQQLLRSIEPEARVVIDGQMYNIGGLIGQTEKAYLIKGSEKKLLSDNNAFQFKGYHIDTIAHYIQWKSLKPDFVVDISLHIDQKMASVLAYASQFYDPSSQAPETPISSKNFVDSIRYRAADLGRLVGVDYAEGFNVERLPAIDSLFDLK